MVNSPIGKSDYISSGIPINGKSYVSWFNLGESGKSIWVGPLVQSQASGMELCASWDLCNLVKGGITNTVRWLPGICMG